MWGLNGPKMKIHRTANEQNLKSSYPMLKTDTMSSTNTNSRTAFSSNGKTVAKWSLFLVVLGLMLSVCECMNEASNSASPGRKVRQVRPTRVSYGDIEKTNKTCAPKDTCAPSRNDRNGAMMNDWKKRNCFCDQQCIVYEDCCVDSPFRRDPNVFYKKSDIFQCVTMKQFGSLYMKTKCPATWTDEMIRKGCEDSKTMNYDPVSSLPLTNMKSGITFKNYYCALCNNQTFTDRMEVWKPRLECPSIPSSSKGEFTNNNIARRLEYRPEAGQWGLNIRRGDNDIWNACNIDPVVPENAEYLIRFCTPTKKDCPPGYNNTDIHRKCLSYTAVVYHLSEGYRNVHCAMCDGINLEDIACTPRRGLGKNIFQYEFNQAAFSFLFDLNPETGLEVGRIQKCSRDEIYDPFFQKCRSILCAPGQAYKDGLCVIIPGTTTKPLDGNDLGDGTDLNALNSNVLESTSASTGSANGSKFDVCPKVVLEREEYQILDNGTVYILAYGKAVSKREYAVQNHDRLVVCAPVTKYYTEKFGRTWGYLSFAGVLVSVICLVLHLIACTMVPELRNLSGKNLASLCVALLSVYSVFLGLPFVQIPSVSCTILAVVLYYSFMAAFCWMLILAWDVAMTLRRATQELRVSSGSQWTRFFFYSIFGWLFPAILVTIAVVAEFLPQEIMPWPYSPNFGTHNCWFGQKPALLIYFAGPVGFILFLNIILFIDAARLISSTTQGTAKAKACGPSHKNFKLYLRLALLMGISWILGIVAGYVDIPALWIVFIIFNTLQGLFIFVAFTCTAKVRKVIRTKLCCASNSMPAASWTWSGIGGNQLPRGSSSSSGHTKRSDLEGRDSSESSPSNQSNGRGQPLHLTTHHTSLQNFGAIGAVHCGKLYRSPSAELYRV